VLDRLISGAGALTDRADRLVRPFTSERGPDIMGSRSGSLLVIVLLIAAALILGLLAIEATDNPTPRTLAPGDVAAAGDLGKRVYSTIGGTLVDSYVEEYADNDGDKVRDPGEKTTNWSYFLVDDGGRGLMVRSARSPDELFNYTVRGVLVRDPEFVSIDVDEFAEVGPSIGLKLEESYYIDTVDAPSGSPTPLHLDEDMLADGSIVELNGTYLTYVETCSDDADGDGDCEDSELDLVDVFVIDPGTGRAITVIGSEPPAPIAAEFTGMLRDDPASIRDTKRSKGFDFPSLGVTVSERYLLIDQAGPANGTLSLALAILAGLLAAVLAVGLAGGYIVFRRSKRPLPSAGRTMESGEWIPVHVTGSLRTANGLLHVREAKAVLVRFPLVTPAGADEAAPAKAEPETTPDEAKRPDADPVLPADVPTTLIVEREQRPEGVGLGRGELEQLTSGRVMPFRGARPALRVVAGTGTLLLSFDSTEARDRAAGELIAEAGLLIRGSVAGGAG
jgi:hypothetical protein